jgi:hypothetical protein
MWGNMLIDLQGKRMGRFPSIQFRKKRLSVTVHAHFDLESTKEADQVKQHVEELLARLAEGGETKVAYTVSDI